MELNVRKPCISIAVLYLFVNFAPHALIHEQNCIEMMKSYMCRALCLDCDPDSDCQSTCTELMIIYNLGYFWAENFCLLLNALFRFPLLFVTRLIETVLLTDE